MSRSKIKGGEAFIELGVVSKVNKGLDAVERDIKGRAKSFARLGLLLTAASGAAVASPIIAAGELQAAMSKLDAVFGDNAEAQKRWAKATANELGVSTREMAQMIGAMQDLLVPMGLVPDQALSMSQAFSKLSVDLASFNDKRTVDTFRDLMAAVTGSSEVMKKYGVIVDVAATNQEILNMGLDPKNASNAIKAQARFNVIMRGTTAAQGDAVRTGQEWTNITRRVMSEFENLHGILGMVIIEDISKFLGGVASALNITNQFLESNRGVARVVAITALGVGALGVSMIGAAGGMWVFSTAVAAASAAVSLLMFVMTPVGAIIAGATIAAVGASAVFLKFAYDAGLMAAGIESMLGTISVMEPTVSGAIQGISDAIDANDWDLAMEIAVEALKVATIDGLSSLFVESVKLIKKGQKALAEEFINGIKRVANIARNVANASPAAILTGEFEFDAGVPDKAESFFDSMVEIRTNANLRLNRLNEQAARQAEEAEKKRKRTLGNQGKVNIPAAPKGRASEAFDRRQRSIDREILATKQGILEARGEEVGADKIEERIRALREEDNIASGMSQAEARRIRMMEKQLSILEKEKKAMKELQRITEEKASKRQFETINKIFRTAEVIEQRFDVTGKKLFEMVNKAIDKALSEGKITPEQADNARDDAKRNLEDRRLQMEARARQVRESLQNPVERMEERIKEIDALREHGLTDEEASEAINKIQGETAEELKGMEENRQRANAVVGPTGTFSTAAAAIIGGGPRHQSIDSQQLKAMLESNKILADIKRKIRPPGFE